MRAALLFICLLLPAQDDATKVLQDPARRAKDADRLSALKTFRDQAASSPFAWAAARFLSKSDKDWKLTPAASAELDAYLKAYGTGASLTEAQHRKALEGLELSIAKAGTMEAAEALKLFLIPHACVLGDRASDIIGKFGYVKEGDRWGKREDLAVAAIAASLMKKATTVGTVTGDAESKARSASTFGPKYAVALFDLSRVFSANQGYETAYKALLTLAGASAPSPRAADHFKALADSFKAAIYCRACKDGKMACTLCNGKKRLDIPCSNCHGLQWAQKPGSAGGILIRCQKCLGIGVFKNAGCPRCSQSGVIACPLCGGRPWRDGFKGCKECTICQTCKGRKETETDCATCKGKGRVGTSPIGVPVDTCDACKGFAIIKANCAACKESGLGPCKNCGDGVRDGKARTTLDDVFTQQPCTACGGKGFPLPNLAVPCERCQGLSFLVLPKGDPAKTLID